MLRKISSKYHEIIPRENIVLLESLPFHAHRRVSLLSRRQEHRKCNESTFVCVFDKFMQRMWENKTKAGKITCLMPKLSKITTRLSKIPRVAVQFVGLLCQKIPRKTRIFSKIPPHGGIFKSTTRGNPTRG
jgi:hypothetical protein